MAEDTADKKIVNFVTARLKTRTGIENEIGKAFEKNPHLVADAENYHLLERELNLQNGAQKRDPEELAKAIEEIRQKHSKDPSEQEQFDSIVGLFSKLDQLDAANKTS